MINPAEVLALLKALAESAKRTADATEKIANAIVTPGDQEITVRSNRKK